MAKIAINELWGQLRGQFLFIYPYFTILNLILNISKIFDIQIIIYTIQ